jgi:hypothetical protein
MRRISSRATFYYKRIFPIMWFGLLALFVVGALVYASDAVQYQPSFFLVIPIGMAIVGFFIMKFLVFDLVDEVLDDGDALIIRNGSQEERVPFSEIMNVSYSMMVNPPRVTLSLRRPSRFGAKVTFCAPLRFIPFSPSPIIDDLIARIDAKRRG